VQSRKPSRELSVGEIISKTFMLYQENFTQYLIPFLIAGTITGLLTTVVSFLITVPVPPEATATPEQFGNWLIGFILTLIALVFVTAIVSWIVGYMAQGICVKFTSDTLEKGNASLLVSFNFTTSKLLSLLGVSIITGLIIFVGFIALVVPGIILMLMFSLVVPTIIIENTGALESLARSRVLVSQRWLKTFGLLLVLYIMIGIVSLIGYLIGLPFGPWHTFVTSIVSTFIAPILPIGLTFYYYSMIARTASIQQPQPTQII
jgi:hypothetical protein